MKNLSRFFGVCVVVFALVIVAGPALAGHPIAIWTGSDDLGAVVLLDFDTSVFTLADVAEIKALLDTTSGSTGDITDFVFVYGPNVLGADSAAFCNDWLLTNYQSSLGADAYIYLQISQSVNQFGTNYDVMVFLTSAALEMTNSFVLGLQMPVVLADSLFDLLAGLL